MVSSWKVSCAALLCVGASATLDLRADTLAETPAGKGDGPAITVLAREIADFGPARDVCGNPDWGPPYPVSSASIAIRGDRRLIASIAASPEVVNGTFEPCTFGGQRVRFGSAGSSGPWRSGYVAPLEDLAGVDDPVVIASPGGAEILLVASAGRRIAATSYKAELSGFAPWKLIAAHGTQVLHHPRIVHRAASEFLVSYLTRDGIASVARTSDGGATWETPRDVATASGRLQQLLFFEPVAGAGGALFAAYCSRTEPGAIRFLTAFEAEEDKGLTFEALSGEPSTVPLAVASRVVAKHGERVPVAFGAKESAARASPSPTLLVDPSSPHRLFLVYHDLAEGSETDMDVFLRTLSRGETGRWSVGPAVRVNRDEAGSGADQFLPGAAVDAFGRLHVFFYDGRDCPKGAPAKPGYRVWYALSTDHGATFAERPLYGCEVEPDIDPALLADQTPYSPRERVGVALDDRDPAKTAVAICYAGTSTDDGGIHKSVVYAARVEVARPK